MRRFSRSVTPERKAQHAAERPPPNPPVPGSRSMTAPRRIGSFRTGGPDWALAIRADSPRIPALGVFPAENVKNFRGLPCPAITVNLPEMDPVPRLTW